MSFDTLPQDMINIIFKILDIRTIYLLANTNKQLFLSATKNIKHLLIDNWYRPLNKKTGMCYANLKIIKKIINIIQNNLDITYENYNLIKYKHLLIEDQKINQIYIKNIDIQDVINYKNRKNIYLFENIIYRTYSNFSNLGQNVDIFINTPIMISSDCSFSLVKSQFRNDVMNLFIIMRGYNILDKYKFKDGWKIKFDHCDSYYLYLRISKRDENLIAQICNSKTGYKSDTTFIAHTNKKY